MIPTFLTARFGPALAKFIFWAVVAALIAAVLGLGKCAYDRTAKTEIAVAKGQTGAALESGKDAVDTAGNVAANAQAADVITKENDDAIHNAEGASVPVAPPVSDAGLRSLCRRAAYSGSARCVQFARP